MVRVAAGTLLPDLTSVLLAVSSSTVPPNTLDWIDKVPDSKGLPIESEQVSVKLN